MKNKYTILAAVFFSAQVFAQNSNEQVKPGKNGFYPEMVRFAKGEEPGFNNLPLLYDEVSKNVSHGQGEKIKTDKDVLGIETSKFQQTINGIPVEYGIMNVHVKDGKVIAQNGIWVKNLNKDNLATSRQKGISEEIALSNALSFVGAESYKWQDAEEEKFLKSEAKDESATYYPKGKLVYYFDPSDLDAKKMTLAYKFDIYAQAPLSRQYVFVDAKSGAILGTDSIIKETNTPGTATTVYSGSQPIVADKVSATSYRLRETGRNAGTAVETYNLKKGTSYARAVDFTDTDNNWNNVNTTLDQYATDAHYGAEKTLDYYYANFGRKSIDNNNFAIKSYVHYSRSYFNAFWDGTRMTYGDGSATNGNKPLTALDVCGHEITHGLTSFTANLAYQKESGALNEGFSDVFGNSVEFWARPTKANWKLGEDFNYVIRDMANPNAYQQPDTYLGTYWVNVVGCTPSSTTNDNCGVHTNSGVLNYWYYLLTNGGSGTNDKGFAYNVTGLGLTKAAAVAYRTLTTYLTSASNYLNARTYSLQAATDLYGASSNEYVQVKNAWDAVGVGGGTSALGKLSESKTAQIYKVVADRNKATVVFNSTTSDVKNIEVISGMGQKVVSTSLKAMIGTNRLEVAIPANTSTGVYLVIVNGEKVGSFIRQ
jgi:bacillolysin